MKPENLVVFACCCGNWTRYAYEYSQQNHFTGRTIASLNHSLQVRLMWKHDTLDLRQIFFRKWESSDEICRWPAQIWRSDYTLKLNTIVKKFPSDKVTHHSFTFNLRFLSELKHDGCLSKSVGGIIHFRFGFIFINVYIFVQQNVWTL